MKTLLVANRGEIAVRVMHAAAELGIRSVAVFSEDDAEALHVRRADQAIGLGAIGPAAYLDVERILGAARACAADAIHPGYGFLSESGAFARRVIAAGLRFVGPQPETLEIFGDKTRARALAAATGVPLLRGSEGPVSLEQARDFFATLPRTADGQPSAVLVKAVAGGGGRGLRVVQRLEDLEEACERCRSEARQAFADDRIYVEQLLPRARHVEIQVLGDAGGAVVHLGERECSLQRRHQKIVEVAPCPGLPDELRARLADDALRLARASGLENAGTFEFLIDTSADPGGSGAAPLHAFLEANPRLQVEHTVTEEVLGLDLVRLQLQIASGRSLEELALRQAEIGPARGHAIQVRVNAESMGRDGIARPSVGTLRAFELPSGHGVRVDTASVVGSTPNPRFDSLLAKVIGHSTSPRFADAVARTRRALDELRVEGVATNQEFLARILDHPDLVAGRLHTRWVEEHLDELVAPDPPDRSGEAGSADAASVRRPGARVDRDDPLAVLAYGKSGERGAREPGSRDAGSRDAHSGRSGDVPEAPGRGTLQEIDAPAGASIVRSLLQGTIVEVSAREGAAVRAGEVLLVMSAMKMEHVVEAPVAGVVLRLTVGAGDTVFENQPLVVLDPRDAGAPERALDTTVDLDLVRPDLGAVHRRHEILLDAARPDAVARRRRTGQRTARENVDDLCDPGSFAEYGGLAIAAQRQRRPLDELVERTPADGLVTGIGRVNAALVGEERARCAVLAYDYTVLAGTQGFLNHRKKDRLFELAERLRLPVVLFAEGGGGRPGDTDAPGVAGLDCMAFHLLGRLSGLVPLVGIASGRCFAGNAALLGCCDVVIATEGSNIGMGGPAMIEGGGLGVFRPEEVGPRSVQVDNGVVDVAVRDEAEAVDVARRYLSYFQGAVGEWKAPDQRRLRQIVPENRLRVYEVREVLETMADAGSVLELRRAFGRGMVTALARIEGRPIGVVANDPRHVGGAIDAPAADKAARFLQLCDAFDLPVLFLCDTPGIMVGPEAEKTALVRHCSRLFVVGASLTVPFFTIVLRKSYGLGAQAMAGGSHKAPVFTVAWPTGEFGGMGLEGAVKLGFRKELAAIEDPAERKKVFEHMVQRAYEHGQALNVASHFEIDEVIDPADSRRWVAGALRAAPPPAVRSGKKRPCVDPW